MQVAHAMPQDHSLSMDEEEDTTSREIVRRRRILQAGKHHFAHNGYDATSLSEIAQAIDMPYAELSHYYDHKLDLLMAIFDDGWSSINLRFADIVIDSHKTRDAMLALMVAMMRILEKDPDLARLLLFEGRRPLPGSGEIRFSKGYQRFMELCTELAARGQRDGSLRKGHPPRLLAAMLVGGAENLLRDRVLMKQETGKAPYSDQMVVAVFDALLTSLH